MSLILPTVRFQMGIWDDEGNIVKISAGQWEIQQNTSPLFYHFKHQAAQIKPQAAGNPELLFNYVNLSEFNTKLLFLVNSILSFVPHIPHTIGIMHGVQGSSKSTASRVLKRLIDPSELDVLILPNDKNELIQMLSHHYLICFDNLTSLPSWVSNLFCVVSTGGGFSKRELYTNDDDVIYKFKRCIVLNGINLVSNQPDFLDRALLFHLQRIDDKNRKTEKEFWEEFEKDLPKILGGIFDTLAKAMEILPTIHIRLPRMADFAKWGCAVAQALGYTSEQFIEAYNQNREEQNEAVIEENVVANAVVRFMENQSIWEGSATNLLQQLNNISLNPFSNNRSEFPASASSLSKSLNVVKSNLIEVGIVIEIDRDRAGRKGRFITITNKNPITASTNGSDEPLIPTEITQSALESLERNNTSDDDDGKLEQTL